MGRLNSSTAQQGEEFFGRLNDLMKGGGVERDRREGVGGIDGSTGGGGGWTDQRLDRGKRGLGGLMVCWFNA
jgi:hypothetical protein